MNKKNFNKHLLEYVKIVKGHLMQLEALSILDFKSIEFNLCELDDADFINKIKKSGIVNGKSFLYYLLINEPFNSNQLLSRLDVLKKETKKDDETYIALPKVNAVNDDCLYVGKSEDEFLTRMKVHFGFTGNKTYGLHLKKWPKLFHVHDNLKLKLFFVEVNLGKEQLSLLEMLENSLHLALKPMLGRSGH